MEKVTVNAMGEPCPIPVVKAKKALAQMNGGVLEVLVDNEIAVQNLLRLASGSGLSAKSEKLDAAKFAVTMIGQPTGQEEPIVCRPDQRGDVLVAVGSATMGTGSDELGKLLMKSFLYALTQQDKLPKTMLFYNGGAHLTVEGSASLEDLKLLESQGVEIFTCGTCLDFYGLKEKLAVGSVTNMYSIVEMLSNAAHVVKP